MWTDVQLFDVRRDELRHLEHRDLVFAVENLLQFFIREDVPLVRRILKIVLLDVFPKLLDHLRAGHRARTDDCLEICGQTERF